MTNATQPDTTGLSEKAAERIAARAAQPDTRQARAEEYAAKWGGVLVEQVDGDWLVVGAITKLGTPMTLRFHADGIAKVEIPKGAASKPVADNDNKKTDGKPSAYAGIISSGDLVRGFTPPDYHIDGVIQARFFYSLTGMTGTGKTSVLLLMAASTALSLVMGSREVRKGRVLYFAGENPTDVTMRWIAMAHEMDFDPDDIDVHFICGTMSIPEMFERIRTDVEKLGGVEMIVVDTSAAYFFGADENSNVDAGRHARDLRKLTELPGQPVVLVACHPVKNAGPDNLLPRGGGAFIAEVDGNLTLAKADGLVRMHWQGKHRGPDFDPIHFELKTVTAPALVDTKGRPVPTVMATAVTEGQVREIKSEARRDEDEALVHIQNGSLSYAAIAEAAGWLDKDGNHHRRRAQTACEKLKKTKLAEYVERVGWKLTKAGEEAGGIIRQQRHREEATAVNIRAMVANS